MSPAFAAMGSSAEPSAAYFQTFRYADDDIATVPRHTRSMPGAGARRGPAANPATFCPAAVTIYRLFQILNGLLAASIPWCLSSERHTIQGESRWPRSRAARLLQRNWCNAGRFADLVCRLRAAGWEALSADTELSGQDGSSQRIASTSGRASPHRLLAPASECAPERRRRAIGAPTASETHGAFAPGIGP